MRGVVTFFGSDGWGAVTATDGTEYEFHSTAVADGTRHIDVDSVVSFELVPGRRGRWEAAHVQPAS